MMQGPFRRTSSSSYNLLKNGCRTLVAAQKYILYICTIIGQRNKKCGYPVDVEDNGE